MLKTNINWVAMTDDTIIKHIGLFIKEKRIAKNKTQAQIAIEAGVNRYTISKIENGGSINLSLLIQILRTLDALYVLDSFSIIEQISPLQAVKLQGKKRKRVRNSREENKPKKDWW